MWNSRLAESVGNKATDAVVVALDMSTLQARRRQKAGFVGIDGVGTTPTRARLKVLADASPQCRNRDTEMQRICCSLLCVRKVDFGDKQAAVESLSSSRSKKTIQRRSVMGRLAARCKRSRDLNSSRSSMIRLCSLLMSAPSPSMGPSKMFTGST
jgi:hypothetical protein